jgi:hypothetical protein
VTEQTVTQDKEIGIRDIKPGYRQGRALGNIGALENSIRVTGLRSPVIVSPQGALISGFRRQVACRGLGWKSVQCTVVMSIEEALLLIDQERADPTCAKPMTALEAMRLDLQMRCELWWWPKKPQADPGGYAGLDHRKLLARTAGVAVHRYEELRRIVAAAEGWQMRTGKKTPVDTETRLAAEEAVKHLGTRDKAAISLACVRFQNRLIPADPRPAPTLSAVKAAVARLTGLAEGFGEMKPPEDAQAGDLRDMDIALTRAIHDLTMHRKRVRTGLAAAGEKEH